MRYVEKHLRLNEHIIDKAKVNWTVTAAAVIRAMIIILIGYGIWKNMPDPIELKPGEIMAAFQAGLTETADAEWTNLIIQLKKPGMFTFMGTWGGLVLCQLVYRILSIHAVELAVTDKKIVGKTGIIRSKSTDAFLDRIDHFTIHESLLGRIFNYAMIEIGTTSSRIRFPYISNASDFRNIVMDCIDKKVSAAINAADTAVDDSRVSFLKNQRR